MAGGQARCVTVAVIAPAAGVACGGFAGFRVGGRGPGPWHPGKGPPP